MQTAPASHFVFICAAVVLTTAMSGCAVGGKSFSMDSNSRVPFFGLELRERKPKSSSPNFSTISRSKSDRARLDTVVQTRGSGSKLLSNRGNDRYVTLSGPEVLAKDSTGIPLSPTMAPNPADEIESIPFPRNDEPSKTVPIRTAATSAPDFH